MRIDKNKIMILPGKPIPLGVSYHRDYTQFALFSRHAEEVSLLLFENANDSQAELVIKLDPQINKTGDVWHVAVYGVEPKHYYAYQVNGPYSPKEGMRYNTNKLLIDPYAKALTGDFDWQLDKSMGYNTNSPKQDLSFSKESNIAYVPKSIVIDDYYDWENDKRPLNPTQNTIIYELHVRGFTQHSSSNVTHRGKFAGLIEKIPYLKDLGVTAVELLPIQEFDENENFRTNPFTGEKLKNYWGYSTISFFSPKGSYCVHNSLGQQVIEFKDMVKEFHKADIEVILDVVFNHTGEGNEKGPTLSFRGIDNVIYYMLENGRYYKNFSGCGNTMNCNHPIVRDFILDCLKYWVVEMHIDGFRFDLASILGRDSDGTVLENPPLIQIIAEDPVLRNTKLIAEAWDAAGLYQVGSFPGTRWAEWNAKFRDTLRSFWKGDKGNISDLATRIAGSSDLYQHSGRRPFHSINFITCHDGFTLRDLVSYNNKHNEANSENNNDGENNNSSYNYGVEGETEDSEIVSIRKRQRKNFMVSLLLSQGVPMLNMGDEFGRTQNGNNNPWCQDNETSWIDWNLLKKESDFHRFVKLLIHFRKNHKAFKRINFFKGVAGTNEIPDINWFDHKGHPLKWEDNVRHIAFFLSGAPEDTGYEDEDSNFFIMMNSHEKKLSFRLPKEFASLRWKIAINTYSDFPCDIFEDIDQPIFNPDKILAVEGRSIIVLQN